MSDAVLAAIEELREQLAISIDAIKEDPKMAEILKLHSALNTMEKLRSLPETSLASAFALEPTTMVQAGEFYGLSALKAAKAFLKKKGKAAHFDEIVSAIREGGALIPSKDKLRVSLGRSTFEIAKVGPEHYGLLEFYPHLKPGKRGKGSESGQAEDETSEAEDAAKPEPTALSLEEVESENE